MRSAGVKVGVVAVSVAMVCPFGGISVVQLSGDSVPQLLVFVAEDVAGGGEGEDQGFARDGFEVRLDGPGEAVRDRACERDGFDLEVEAAVALLVGPVCVEAVEEAVVAGGRDLVD